MCCRCHYAFKFQHFLKIHCQTKEKIQKDTNTLEDIFTSIHISKDATQNIVVQKAILLSLAQQELQAQGGAVRQHDKPTTGGFPAHLTYWQWCPERQLRRSVLLKNGPQPTSTKFPERAESLYGLLTTAQAPASELGWGKWFGEPWLACEPSAQCTPEEKEMQLHANSG